MKSINKSAPTLPQSPQVFTTQSAFCAAWLMYSGHALSDFRMVSPPKGEFVFELTGELQNDLARYFDGSAEVNLRAFVRCYNSARDTIFNLRREVEATATVKMINGR